MADQRIEPILAKSAAQGASAIPVPVVVVAVPKFGRPKRMGHLLEREHILAGVLLAPTLVILTLFIAYPFVLGIWLNLNDTIFLPAFQNTFVYTFLAAMMKLLLGMGAALLLNQPFRFKRIVR